MPKLIDHARLLTVLAYDPVTGVFTWKVRTSNRIKVGQLAGADDGNGYIVIRVDGRLYAAQRLAWFYVHGVWPAGIVDHWDGNTTNNALANLRDVTKAQNAMNSLPSKANTSGHRGVYLHGSGRYRAKISVHGKQLSLGYFDRLEDAVAAREQAERRHFGEFSFASR